MKISRLIGGTLAVLALTISNAAQADTEISFGRMVYGYSNKTIVLPQDAWKTEDNVNTGAGQIGYTDDGFGAVDYSAALFSVGGSGTDGYNGTGAFSPGGSGLNTAIDGPTGGGTFPGIATTLELTVGKITANTNDTLKFYNPNAPATLYNVNEGTPTVVTNPFAFAVDNQTGQYNTPYTRYQQDGLNDGGFKQAKVYKDSSGLYWIGFEDLQQDQSDHDFNDVVFRASLTPIPEPAFYQMAGLLVAGGLGFVRLRRRKSA